MIAEGTWTESYADAEGLRDQFHNAAEFHALYPDHRAPEELSLCAPRPERGAKLDAVLRPVVARAWAGRDPGQAAWLDRLHDRLPQDRRLGDGRGTSRTCPCCWRFYCRISR